MVKNYILTPEQMTKITQRQNISRAPEHRQRVTETEDVRSENRPDKLLNKLSHAKVVEERLYPHFESLSSEEGRVVNTLCRATPQFEGSMSHRALRSKWTRSRCRII